MTDYQEVRTIDHDIGREQRIATFKVTQMIWLLLGLLEAAIALRVVFKLIAVNPGNPFATLLYSVTNLFVTPFVSLTSAPAVGRMVLEISSIIAMIVYLLAGWALERLVYVLFYRPRGSVRVRQTTVADHPIQQEPLGASQNMTTERVTTPQTPTVASQTIITDSSEG